MKAFERAMALAVAACMLTAAPSTGQEQNAVDVWRPGEPTAPPAGLANEVETPAPPIGEPDNAVLYDNGPLATGPTTTIGGAPAPAGTVWSEVTAPNTIAGYGQQGGATNNRVTDDFTVPPGASWDIKAVRWPMYQTGAGTATPTITNICFSIGTTPGAGDIVPNTCAPPDSGVFAAMYRIFANTPATNRPVWSHTRNVNVTLGPGTYWVSWQSTGTLASGPWAPNVTVVGNPAPPSTNGAANGMQSVAGGAYAPVTDAGGPQGFAFQILGQESGPSVCETCSGDGNGDGKVNSDDIRFLVACLVRGGAACGPCLDMDGDGSITLDDVPVFVFRLLEGDSDCLPDIEDLPDLPGAGPDRTSFDVSLQLGPPFNGTADGEGTLTLQTGGTLSFFDVFWDSPGTAVIPPFHVRAPGQTPIQVTPTGTEWTLDGNIDVDDPNPQIEPDAAFRVALMGPPPTQLIEPGARYEINPSLPSAAIVLDPTAFGGLPAGTQIPITQHPVKIKKYCIYRITAMLQAPPPWRPCPPGWNVGMIMCVECDLRQKQGCPRSGWYFVRGRCCLVRLDLQFSQCTRCPPGFKNRVRFANPIRKPRP